MLPKKEPPLVRAETICCILAAVIVAICLAHHPRTNWPLAVTLVLLIAAIKTIRTKNNWGKGSAIGGAFLLPDKKENMPICPESGPNTTPPCGKMRRGIGGKIMEENHFIPKGSAKQ